MRRHFVDGENMALLAANRDLWVVDKGGEGRSAGV
jgi:hypothetical protein